MSTHPSRISRWNPIRPFRYTGVWKSEFFVMLYAFLVCAAPRPVRGGPFRKTDDLTNRQRSILAALEKGDEIRVATVVELLGCSPTTAKRDLAPLRKRKLIRFDGPAKTGCYKLVGERVCAEGRVG